MNLRAFLQQDAASPRRGIDLVIAALAAIGLVTTLCWMLDLRERGRPLAGGVYPGGMHDRQVAGELRAARSIVESWRGRGAGPAGAEALAVARESFDLDDRFVAVYSLSLLAIGAFALRFLRLRGARLAWAAGVVALLATAGS